MEENRKNENMQSDKRDTGKIARSATGTCIMLIGAMACYVTRAEAIAEGAGMFRKVLYAGSLIAVIVGLLIFGTAFMPKQKTDIRKLTMAAMMAALCYIGFAFLKIDIPVPGSMEKSAFHLGNVFCVLAALILGGVWGGLAGAVGMTIGDLFGGYVTSAPKTFFLKLCIGLITGLFAHRILNLAQEKERKKVVWKTVVSASAGMLFNVVFDPLVGYFYKKYLFGLPQDIAATLSKIGAGTTFVNAVVAVFAASVFYIALRPALKHMGIIEEQPK